MTTELSAERVRLPLTGRTLRIGPAAIAATAAGFRLIFLGLPAGPDESGFLMVAHQWQAGGSSLYGNYWVDRPPLLIGLFRIGDLMGGLWAVRVLAAVAVGLTVWILSATAHRLYGRRAALWTAVAAAALLVSPLTGAERVNGELLAAPFLALGFFAVVGAVQAEDPFSQRAYALLLGGATAAAMLVKQNMADAAVFAVIAWVLAWRMNRIDLRRLGELLGLSAVGGTLVALAVMLEAMARGTAPGAVFDAMYPFRLQAAQLIASTGANASGTRLESLLVSFALTGAPLIPAMVLRTGVRRFRDAWALWAALGTLGYTVASILAGGSYWLHYLIEAVPALSVILAAISLARPRTARSVTGILVVSALVATVPALGHDESSGVAIGRSVAAASRPGDTVVSLFGDADIVKASGLYSPYPYLWSVPARTLDPHEAVLSSLLRGSRAPTWVVVRGPVTEGWLADGGALAVIHDRYRAVGSMCGRTVYLLDGQQRSPLTAMAPCALRPAR